MSAENKEFAVSLCGVGSCGTCLYSWCCPHCSSAQARTKLDGSSCCFNFCCFQNPITLRWLVRNAYGIEGSAWEDCAYGTCCPCCVINQVHQTTTAYGAPNPTAGAANNRDVFRSQAGNENCFLNCLYSWFCPTCAIGTVMNNVIDMPFLMGCCLMTPCAARNVMRYHYKIQGDDMCDDCLTPMIAYYCICTPCGIGYFLNFFMKMLSESQLRSVNENFPKQYLASPPQSSAPAVTMVASPVVAAVAR